MIRCLTVRQPWASLIVAGIKDVENRSRATSYRGPLLIHAGATWDRFGMIRLAREHLPELISLVEIAKFMNRPAWQLVEQALLEELPFGAIIGQVDLVDGGAGHSSPWALPGHAHWALQNAVKFNAPVPCKGRLGFWRPPADILAELEKDAAHVPCGRGGK